MSFAALLTDLERLGIRPVLRDGRVKLAGRRSRLTSELIEKARAHRGALDAYARAEEDRAVADKAVELLNRLKGYVIPAGRMSAVRGLAVQMRGLTAPDKMLSALKNFERELITIGGEYDPRLAKAVDIVHRIFPAAQLILVCNLR